jgi:dTDP-4-dehydrorhamnose reductase
MKIAITGSQGQLGMELLRQYEPRRPDFEPGCVTPEPISLVGLDLPQFDLTDRDHVLEKFETLRPDVIINTAAFTLVDKAEQEADLCRRINVEGLRNLVAACRRLDCALVQISTDYVFGRDAARRTPYRETDEPGPQGVYGQTKLDGERAAAQWPKHLIVRTCGLYGRLGQRSAGNFVETMLRLAANNLRSAPGRSLRVVDDQQCAPTYVPHLARAIRFLVAAGARGTYHVVNAGQTTWCEFAREIFRQSRLDVPVEPITTAQYGAPAPRPAYSILDTAKYHSLAGCPKMPSWQDALAEYLACRQI